MVGPYRTTLLKPLFSTLKNGIFSRIKLFGDPWPHESQLQKHLNRRQIGRTLREVCYFSAILGFLMIFRPKTAENRLENDDFEDPDHEN